RGPTCGSMALGVWGAVSGAGAAVGVLLGGVLTDWIDRRGSLRTIRPEDAALPCQAGVSDAALRDAVYVCAYFNRRWKLSGSGPRLQHLRSRAMSGAAIGAAKDEQTHMARRALERVCARGDFEAAQELYSGDFIDHVNGMEFRGRLAFASRLGSTGRPFRIFGSK